MKAIHESLAHIKFPTLHDGLYQKQAFSCYGKFCIIAAIDPHTEYV